MKLIRLARFWRQDAADELDEELRYHLERLVEEGRAAGLDEAKAHARAAERMGDLRRVRAECAKLEGGRARSLRLRQALADLRQDLGFALRQLGRRCGMATGVVLALALGLGANATFFGAIDALLLRPLPGVADPGALVELPHRSISVPALRDFAGQSQTLAIAGFSHRSFALESRDVVDGAVVSGDFFEVLRVRPAAGRLLGRTDDEPGAPLVAVVREGFAASVGSRLLLNGRTAEVVGVVPRELGGLRVSRRNQVYVTVSGFRALAPTQMQGLDLQTRTWNWLTLVGRLRAGATLQSARAELAAIASRIREAHPDSTQYAIALVPLSLAATGLSPGQVALFAGGLTAVAALVLLLACANVANLLLAHGLARSREMAVRRALGASRGRLVRQLLTEALSLALLGGAAGFALAALAGEALSGLRLPNGGRLPELALAGNARALAFCAALSIGSTLLFGLLPALQATRAELASALKESGADGRARSRLRDALLIAQVAFSLVLLVGAGLFLRGLQRGLHTEVGFRPERIAFATIDAGLVHEQPGEALAQYAEAARALQPTEVAWTSTLPLSDDQDTYSFRIAGEAPPQGEQLETDLQVVSPELFRTLGLPFVEGRAFGRADGNVAVVSQAFARKWLAGGAVGRRIQLTTLGPTEIVGVVADARFQGLEGPTPPLVYLPLAQNPRASAMTLLARSEGDPRALVAPMRAALGGAAPGVPILASGTLEDQLADLLAPQRLGSSLLAAFAALGLLLASVGTASVVAFALAQRTRELGIRLALGADGPRLLRMVLAQMAARLVAGLALGFCLAVPAARALSGLLYGIGPADGWAFGAAAGALLAAGIASAYLPARRVLRIDPMAALRAD